MKKLLFFILILAVCILLIPKETNENIAIKVFAQTAVVVFLGIIYFVAHFFIYDLPKRIKKKKYEQNYPLTAKKFPISCLSKGDNVFLKTYGEGIYNGKDFSRKHIVWIKRKGDERNEMKEFSEQELSELIEAVSCEFGIKWEKEHGGKS